jgi:hypothetical protein
VPRIATAPQALPKVDVRIESSLAPDVERLEACHERLLRHPRGVRSVFAHLWSIVKIMIHNYKNKDIIQ